MFKVGDEVRMKNIDGTWVSYPFVVMGIELQGKRLLLEDLNHPSGKPQGVFGAGAEDCELVKPNLRRLVKQCLLVALT